MEFPKNEVMTLIMNGMKGGDTDTESWAIPALLTFYYFLLMNAKVVVTDSIMPLFNSSKEITDTLVLDSPHQSIKYILQKQNFNIDDVYPNLVKLITFYSINIDVYGDGGKPNWNHLNEISRDIATDLISVFEFMKKKQRNDKRDSLYENEASNYILYFKKLGGEKQMGLISKVVDSYASFYSAKDYSSYGLVRPVGLVAGVILKTDLKTLSTMEEDLKLMLIGELRRWTGSVISGNAKGYVKLRGNELDAALKDFVEIFFNEVFKEYCDKDVSTLKSRLNRFSAGCEAYYIVNYKNKKSLEEENQDA